MVIEKLIPANQGTLEKIVAGTNDVDVPFEINAPAVGFRICGIKVVPHDADTPKAPVDTIWRLRLYRRAAMDIDDIVYEDTRYNELASSVPSLDKTEWEYNNADGIRVIYGTIGIQAEANDCSFTIAVDFRR